VTSISPSAGRASVARYQLPRLAVHQFHADLRCFVRNKGSVFFTLALPILFLVIFGSVFQHQNVAVPGGRIDEPVYYVPGIIAYGLIAATFSNLVVSVVRYRETGIYNPSAPDGCQTSPATDPPRSVLRASSCWTGGLPWSALVAFICWR
jgi:hypothetical protein